MSLSQRSKRKAKIVTFFFFLISLLTGLEVKSNGSIHFSIEHLLIPFWILPVFLLMSFLLLALLFDWVEKKGASKR
jgi:hypothetical protein